MKKFDPIDLGNRIKLARIHAKIKRADLAKSIGITSNFMGMIEKGRPVSLQTFCKICSTLNVDANFLLS